MKKKEIITLCILFIILIFINNISVLAGTVFSDHTDPTTKIRSIHQYAHSSGLDSSESKIEHITVNRKSLIICEIVNHEDNGSDGDVYIYRSDNYPSNYEKILLPIYVETVIECTSSGTHYYNENNGKQKYFYPNNHYYISTHAETGSWGTGGKGEIWLTIKPYFNLTYTETGGNGSVKFYKNGSNIYTFTGNITKNEIAKAGDRIYLTASPDTGYRFVRWQGAYAGTGTTTSTFYMNRDKNFTAVFEVKPVSFPTDHIEYYNNGSIQIDWDFESSSTDFQYQVALTETNVTAPAAGDIIETANNQNWLYNPVEDPYILDSNKEYYLWVRPIDSEGNLCPTWKHSSAFSPGPPSSAVTIKDLNSEIIDGQPFYSVELKLDDLEVDSYIIERKKADKADMEDWDQIDEISYENLSQNNFIYIDNKDLESHGRYIYKVYTQNAVGDKSGEEVSNQVEIPNIKADLDLPVIAGVPTNNTELYIDLPENDEEGDSIKFRLLYKLDREEAETYRSSVELKSEAVRINFPSDGEWQWWLEVEESSGSYKTDPPYETEKRTINIDTVLPEGKLSIIGESAEEYTVEKPTKNQDIRLDIKDITDSSGVIDSGIEKIIVYNGTVKPAEIYNIRDALDTEGNLKEEIAVEIGKGETGITIGIDRLTEAGEGYRTNLPWRLTDNDGEKTVAIEIRDKAANSAVISKSCLLDMTPPPLSREIQHKHSIEDGENIITYTWKNSAEDVSSFKIGEETVQPSIDDQEIITGSYRINVADMGFNQAVSIEIVAVDKAGNRSVPAGYTAYTKAKVGSIGEISGGYNEENKHYLEFPLIETEPSDSAAYHEIEYGTVLETDEFNKGGSIKISGNNSFIHKNLEAHQKSSYCLAAYNNSGDASYGTAFSAQVPNTAPTEAVIDEESYPQDWTVDINESNELEFSYIPAHDVDHDTLDHIIYWAEGNYLNSEPERWYKINAGDPDHTPLIIDPGDPAEHGRTYTWYVKAKELEEEYHEESISERVTFTVDLNPPVLEMEEVGLYTNKKSLIVWVSDIKEKENPAEIYSDIDHLVYKLTYSDGTQTEESKINGLIPAGNKNWKGELPLIEGEYTIQAVAVDKAANSSELVNKELKVDYTVPEIKSSSLEALKESGIYRTYKDNLKLNIEMEDPLSSNYASGIRKLNYWFVLNKGDENSQEAKVKNIVPDIETDSYQLELDSSGLVDGKQYYLVFQAEDLAGNKTEIEYSDAILIDRTAPLLSLRISGLKPYGSKNYLADLEDLNIEVSAHDEESGTTELGYNIYSMESGEYLYNQWTELLTVKNSSLIDGQEYYLAYRAFNGVGNSAIVKSKSFIYDSSAPTGLSLTVPEGKFISGETISFKAEAEDGHSPLSSYRLVVGSSPGGNELTSLIVGNIDGYITMEFIDSKYRLRLPEIEDGRYYTTLLVSNAAGKTTVCQGGEIEIDNSQERLVVNDEGPYTASDSQLSAEWQYSGENEMAEYSYRIKIKDGGYLTEEKRTTKNRVSEIGLELEEGESYQYEVTALFGETPPLTAESAGVTVDTTDPVIESFTSAEYSISDEIKFDWEGYDKQSGILKVEVALGTDYNRTDATDGWVELIDNTLNYDSRGEALELETGRHYYPMLRLTNGAGRQTDINGSSIIIDDTAPPEPLVDDHAQYINFEQPIILDWTMTELKNRLDEESGNLSYYWTYSKNKADLTLDNQSLNWNQAGSQLKLRFENIARIVGGEIASGTNYYFAVKAVNGVGLESIGITDGLIVDINAPSIPELKVLSTINIDGQEVEMEVNYLNSLEDLKLWISSTDRESRVNKYMYGYGLKGEAEDSSRVEYFIQDEDEYNQAQIIDIENPDIEEGLIYQFVGESYNGAELVSQTGKSSGVLLDISAPRVIDVNGTASGDRLIFDWEIDPESSDSKVVRYETALVTDPTQTVEEWNNNGLSKTITINASTLDDGSYYLKVRAFNAAGNHSRSGQEYDEVGISPVVILDRKAPEVTELAHPEYVHNGFEAIIKVLDNESGSGISSYQYALGTYVNPTLYSGEWQEVINIADHAEIEDQLRTNLETAGIKTGEEIYLRARVKDNVNRWSEIKRSSKITVDHTPPVVENISISGPETVNTKDRIMDLTLEYDGAEEESKISHYRISVASEKDLQNWETDPLSRPIWEFNNQVEGLDLEEKGYYLVVELFNPVGLSTVKYSAEKVVIDLTAPLLTFLDPADEIVFNNPSIEDPAEIKYTVSETADLTFVLTKPGGEKIEYQTEEGLTAGQEHSFEFTEYAYGIYVLTPTLVDRAGNIMDLELSKNIRVNEPPRLNFAEDENGIAIYTTKGKVVTLSLETASDSDGSIVSYQWESGEEPTVTLTGPDPEYKYTELGEYPLTVSASDNDGGITTITTKVKVENTSRGQLYMDETWSGTHRIYDDILVPAGIKLTVLAGTEILIDGIPGETAYNHLLDIQGELEINGQKDNQVKISSVLSQPGSWQGVEISGQADITALDIKDALRGITILQIGEADIRDSIFRDNKVGIHVYGSSPLISNSQFVNNLLYGIKEDQGGRPVVIDSLFTGNGIDYYHQELNRISIEYLNSIDRNSGNRGQ